MFRTWASDPLIQTLPDATISYGFVVHVRRVQILGEAGPRRGVGYVYNIQISGQPNRPTMARMLLNDHTS
jgi:hypothetical protein